MNELALQCAHITVSYGAVKAIDDLSYDFEKGLVYGLTGPAGAGKTTLLNVFAGRQLRHQGAILCDGVDISHLPAYERARRGMGHSFQAAKTFPHLTVFENLHIAARAKHTHFLPGWAAPGYDPHLSKDIDAMLDLTGLGAYRERIAGSLSCGLRRALELGIALMPDPHVLLLDEPLDGIGEHELDNSIRLIQTLCAGRTVLLTADNMEAIMMLSERIVVMNNGRLMADGMPDEMRANPDAGPIYLEEKLPA